MKKSYQDRDNRKGGYKGGKSFGGRKFDRKGEFDGGSSPRLYDAQCNNCGKDCQVPFKPNGRKPVLCSFCFKKEDGGAPKRFGKPSFGDKRQFNKFGDKPKQDTAKIEKRLASIEKKLDMLIDALTEEEEEGNKDLDQTLPDSE